MNRYVVEPAELKWPSFKILGTDDLTQSIIGGLSLLVFVYVIGHMLAYVSSQLIEKTIDRFFGKVSTAIVFLTVGRPGSRNSKIRRHVRRQMARIIEDRAVLASLFRGIFHLPALPLYAAIGIFGVFGYFNSRMSKHTVALLKQRVAALDVPQLRLSPNIPWYKPVEYYVINRVPTAVPRMYNYLVIGGLFRSLTLIFLASMWAVFVHVCLWKYGGEWKLAAFSGLVTSPSGILEYGFLLVFYAFSLFSYIKFQRRYAEETIFAFLFAEDHRPGLDAAARVKSGRTEQGSATAP